jgi:hypothetical protein
MELIRRLRYAGYLDQIGITEREPGEVFEKLIGHLASTQEWAGYRTPTSRGSDRPAAAKKAAKKTSKKAAKKSSKKKGASPEPEESSTEPVKLHYIVDRRDFLEKVKSVYAAYAA